MPGATACLPNGAVWDPLTGCFQPLCRKAVDGWQAWALLGRIGQVVSVLDRFQPAAVAANRRRTGFRCNYSMGRITGSGGFDLRHRLATQARAVLVRGLTGGRQPAVLCRRRAASPVRMSPRMEFRTPGARLCKAMFLRKQSSPFRFCRAVYGPCPP